MISSPQRRLGRRRTSIIGVVLVLFATSLLAVGHHLLHRRGAHHDQSLDMCLIGGTSQQRTSVFLFIGVISARNNWDRRRAVRNAWADASQVRSKSATRFFVPSDGPTDGDGPDELAGNRDFVWLEGDNSYQTLGGATLAVFHHVVATYDFSFVLKADDDSFVNVPALTAVLRQQCRHPGCQTEGVYLGSQVEGTVVTHGQKDHPHNSDEFWAHTGLTTYPKYMVGGGYVISDDVARMLVITSKTVGLKSYTVEDATFGYWVQPWDVRHINHTRFRTIATECCFNPGHTEVDILPGIAKDLCSEQPWLILHKIVETNQLRIIGKHVRECGASSAGAALKS